VTDGGEERILRSKKSRILKFYRAVKDGRMPTAEAIKEISQSCAKETHAEVLEFKDEALRRLRELEQS
jgi:hypothetical protein